MVFRYTFSHAVNMNVEMRSMFVQDHDNILGPAVGESRY